MKEPQTLTETGSPPPPPKLRRHSIFAVEVDHDTSGGTRDLEPGFPGDLERDDTRCRPVLFGERPGTGETGPGAGAPAFRGPGEYQSLTPDYRPPRGIPGPILAAASSFPYARSTEHRDALARMETALLHYGAARVRGDRTPLPEKRLPLILRAKLERGEWCELKPVSRYRDGAGEPRTLPRVLSLSLPYALELIRQDTGERYAEFLDYLNGRRLPVRVPRVMGLPADIAAYLEAGTGLIPEHETALRVLYSGEKPRGWRLLALEPPGRVLRPSWCGKQCGRFYALRPPLQCLPKQYRLAALFPAGAGEGFAELDFQCCHPNIAHVLAGHEPAPDFYGELAELAGYSRDHVKSMVLPILHGRTRAEHINRYGRRSAGFYDGILSTLAARGDELTRLESDILRGVLRRMKAAGIPAGLPLHDSILTTEPGAVAGFMAEESERVLRVPLPVKITPAGPERLPL